MPVYELTRDRLLLSRINTMRDSRMGSKKAGKTPISIYIKKIIDICDTSGHKLAIEFPHFGLSPDTLYDAYSGRTTPRDESLELFSRVLAAKLAKSRSLIHPLQWRPEYESASMLYRVMFDIVHRGRDPKEVDEPLDGRSFANLMGQNFGRLSMKDKQVAAGRLLAMLSRFVSGADLEASIEDQVEEGEYKDEEDYEDEIDLTSLIEAIDAAMVKAQVKTIEEYAYHLGDEEFPRRHPKMTALISGLKSIVEEGELPSEDSDEFTITLMLLASDLSQGAFNGDPSSLLDFLVYGASSVEQ